MNNQNRIFNKGISTPIGIIIIVTVALIAGGVLAWQYGWIENISIVPPKKEGPSELESVLYQLTQAEDYQTFGKQHVLDIVDSKVRVEIELVDSDYSLPSEFGIEEVRFGNLVQALVFIDRLLDLASNPSIDFVRTPQKPIPMDN